MSTRRRGSSIAPKRNSNAGAKDSEWQRANLRFERAAGAACKLLAKGGGARSALD